MKGMLRMAWFLAGITLVMPVLGQELRVGVVLPLSGEHRSLGRAAFDGLSWGATVSEIPIRFELRDSQGKAEVAAEAVRELALDPEIAAIVGPLGAIESEAAAKAAQDVGIPILVLSSADNLERLGGWVFRLRVSPEDQSRMMAQLAVAHLDTPRVAVFYPENTYGRQCAEAFSGALIAAGGELVRYESYDPDDTKIKKEAERISGKRTRVLVKGGSKARSKVKKQARAVIDFDALFVPDAASRLPRTLAFLDVAGVPLGEGSGAVQLLGTNAWDGEGLRLTEGLATRALVPLIFDAGRDDATEIEILDFVDRFEREPTALEVQARDGLVLLAASVTRCRSDLSRSCVLQGLRSGASVEGLGGSALSFSREGAPVRSLLMFDVGAAGELWPAY